MHIRSDEIAISRALSTDGFKPLDEKVELIKNFRKTKTREQLRRYLGMVKFYRKFIPRATETQIHLNTLLRDSRKKDKRLVEWNKTTEKAFEETKQQLAVVTRISFPKPNTELRLVTDASDFAMGATLEQLTDGNWKPLAFRSEKLSESQRKYSAFDRELVAIYFALKHFYYDLIGREFKIFTDQKPITFVLKKSHDKIPEVRKRRLDLISEFNTSIYTIIGECNVVADTLSRIDAIGIVYWWSPGIRTEYL